MTAWLASLPGCVLCSCMLSSHPAVQCSARSRHSPSLLLAGAGQRPWPAGHHSLHFLDRARHTALRACRTNKGQGMLGGQGHAHKNVGAAPIRGSDWHPPGMPTGAPREWVSAAHGHTQAPGSQLSRGPLHPAPLAVTTTSSSMRTPPKPCTARAGWHSAARVGAACCDAG